MGSELYVYNVRNLIFKIYSELFGEIKHSAETCVLMMCMKLPIHVEPTKQPMPSCHGTPPLPQYKDKGLAKQWDVNRLNDADK